jgi:prephenate dehydratase
VLTGRPRASLDRVERVLSHPVALAQCTRFFREHRWIAAVPVFDTAGAVPLALDDATGATAAIASRRAAALHGADVLLDGFQDHDDNRTRFVLVVPRHAHTAVAGWPRKAMLACRLRHEPGSLARLLRPFAERGLDLTRIESRPIQDRPFEYLFVLEVQADSPVQRLTEALDEAAAAAAWLRVLGVFAPDLTSPATRDAAAGPPAATSRHRRRT